MSEAVVVGVRVRPFNQREIDLNAELCIEMEGPTTTIRNPDFKDLGGNSKEDGRSRFTFDQSFWSHDGFRNDEHGYHHPVEGSHYADQTYVFDTFGKRVLDNAWQGFHCCLFAYGQTGAGKSYSMVGYGANKGIIPISCDEIFSRIGHNAEPNLSFEVQLCMVEIYNEAVQDLFTDPEQRPKGGLPIRESKAMGVYVDGAKKIPVASYEEINDAIEEATSNRTVGATAMNATSSRAHTVTTMEFKQILKEAGKEKVKLSMINLVDLAGSEKANQTGAAGSRLKEGIAINSSLTALGNVIEKLAERSQLEAGGKKKAKEIPIPYRDSKLTRLLQNALGGSSKTIMICALSPASSNYEETMSTLRYADRAKKIKNTATVNEDPTEKLIREIREENSKLKEMLEAAQAGNYDFKQLAEKQEEVQRMERLLSDHQEVDHDRRQASKTVFQNRRTKRMSMALITGPYLCNLNEDLQLCGKLRYELKEGRTRLGRPDLQGNCSSDDNEDGMSSEEDLQYIAIYGPGILAAHATITNNGGACQLSCTPKAAGATWVNGESVRKMMGLERRSASKMARLMSVLSKPRLSSWDSDQDAKVSGISLKHTDYVTFGQSIYVMVDPQCGDADKLLATGEVSYSKAKRLLPNSWQGARSTPLSSPVSRADASETEESTEEEAGAICSMCRKQTMESSLISKESSEIQQRMKFIKELQRRDRKIAKLQEEIAKLRAYAGLARGDMASLSGNTDGDQDEDVDELDELLRVCPTCGLYCTRCSHADSGDNAAGRMAPLTKFSLHFPSPPIASTGSLSKLTKVAWKPDSSVISGVRDFAAEMDQGFDEAQRQIVLIARRANIAEAKWRNRPTRNPMASTAAAGDIDGNR